MLLHGAMNHQAESHQHHWITGVGVERNQHRDPEDELQEHVFRRREPLYELLPVRRGPALSPGTTAPASTISRAGDNCCDARCHAPTTDNGRIPERRCRDLEMSSW